MLDREYDARIAAGAFDKASVYRRESERVLASADRIADLVYDEASQSKLDIYPSAQGAPLFVWIHGGYWRSSTKDENAFVAPAFVAQGVRADSDQGGSYPHAAK